MKSSLEQLCLPIKQELQQVEEVIRENLKSSVPFVSSVAEYVIANGGKRLRPALCLFASRIAGATGRSVLESAAAMEFFHTATLMHDDVLDNANIRRGQPSANAQWGNHVAVLVGDFFYCQASKLLVGTGNLKVVELITNTMLSTTEGEILEITKSNDLTTTEEEYLKIITHKTAVLMAASCAAGGVLANVSTEYTQALSDYGTSLGIAFQLSDDVLDYVSDEVKFGKTKGTDLKEGKLTLPLIVALRHGNEQEKRTIRDSLIAKTLEDHHLKEILSLIQQYGGIEYTMRLARTYAEKARKALAPFKQSIEKETLLSLASFVVDRNQ